MPSLDKYCRALGLYHSHFIPKRKRSTGTIISTSYSTNTNPNVHAATEQDSAITCRFAARYGGGVSQKWRSPWYWYLETCSRRNGKNYLGMTWLDGVILAGVVILGLVVKGVIGDSYRKQLPKQWKRRKTKKWRFSPSFLWFYLLLSNFCRNFASFFRKASRVPVTSSRGNIEGTSMEHRAKSELLT